MPISFFMHAFFTRRTNIVSYLFKDCETDGFRDVADRLKECGYAEKVVCGKERVM